MALKDHLLFTRLLRTRPLLPAALMLLCGCIIGCAADSEPLLLILAAAAVVGLAVAALILRRNRRAALALLVAAMLPLGVLRFDASWKQTSPLPDQTHAPLTGRICEVPQYNSETERCICVLENISIDGLASQRKLRLYLRGDTDLLQQVSIGQTVSCEAHIWQADGATNPGQFSFSNYLRLQGLSGYATADIKTAAFTEAQTTLRDLPQLARARLSEKLNLLFPENASLAKAFLLGDRSGLSQEDRDSFSQSGIAHLLAISGMHISVLASAVSMLLGRFVNRRPSFIVTLVLLCLYGTLLGFTASLSRAIIFFAISDGGMFVDRRSDSPTRLSAAMILCLLVRPESILDAGFVLSFSASAGVTLLYAPLADLLHTRPLMHLYPQHPLARSGILLLRWVVGICITSLAAQLAVLPGVAYYFGAQPLFSIVANLPAIPLAMAAFVISIGESLLSVPLSLIPGLAPRALMGDYLFGLLKDSASFFANLPMSTLRVPRFPTWLALLTALALFLSAGFCRLPRRVRHFLPFVSLLAVLAANLCCFLPSLGCSVVFLDAGQADCAVLRAQGDIYLIDTGDSYSPAADYLSAMNYGLKGVFLSHLHIDHAGGLASLLDRFTPENIYLSANWSAYEADEAVLEALDLAQDRGCKLTALSAGDELCLTDEVRVQVLSPEAGVCAEEANDDSLVLRLEYRGTSALFTGDASAGHIAGALTDADLLKLPHHGAEDSLSEALLARVAPSVTVISVGYNSYGHPTEHTLNLLARSGTVVLRTDLCGAITCRLGENGHLTLHPFLSGGVVPAGEPAE